MSRNASFEQIKSPGIFVAGIAIRTTNQNDRAQTDIGNLWAKFMNENIAGQIAARLSNDIYCVYTDYENDHTGWYTTVLGCRIDNPDDSEGMFTALIPKGSYRLYRPEGEVPGYMISTRQQICADCHGRNFIADYDLYSGNKAEIYVGVI